MSLHYSNGQLLLQNTSDSEWYYLGVRVDSQDNLPHLYPTQEIAGDFVLSNFDSYAIIRDEEGDLYKLTLYTNVDGDVTFGLELATLPVIQRPVRIFIKDTSTGLLYQLTSNGGYPALSLASSIVTTGLTLDRPFACATPVTTTANSCKSPASFFSRATVLIPAQVPLPNGALLLGAGGEGILGPGGENMEGTTE